MLFEIIIIQQTISCVIISLTYCIFLNIIFFFFFNRYLLQLIVFVKLNFNFSISFALSWVDKVATGKQSLVSIIENNVAWFALLVPIMQFLDQFRSRLISQLLNGISIVLEKLFRYFNGTILSVFFVLSSPVSPIHSILRLNYLVVALF